MESTFPRRSTFLRSSISKKIAKETNRGNQERHEETVHDVPGQVGDEKGCMIILYVEEPEQMERVQRLLFCSIS